MGIADYIKRAGKHVNATRRHARCLPVWVRFSSLVLAVSMTGAVAVGIPLHSSDRGCNAPTQIADCEHMGRASVTSAALCCLISCQEPAHPGSEFTVQRPSLNGGFLHQVALASPLTLRKPLPQSFLLQSASFTPPETYLKNLALLI